MFSAFTETKEWIHLLDLTDSQIFKLPTRNYSCPDCGLDLLLKRGTVKAPHFAHLITCPASSESPSESAVHLEGKHTLYLLAQSHFQDVRIEYYFEVIQQRADLYLPTQQVVLEYQCSKIPYMDILTRQFGYTSQKIDCLWILHTKHIPICTKGFYLIKLSQFLQSCIRNHKNGMKSLLFWDSKRNVSYFLFIYDSFAHNEFIIEIVVLNEMKAWMWLASPKPTSLPERVKQQILYHHQLKQIDFLFSYENRETYPYHRLARKWKVSAPTFPLYIGLATTFTHTLGREVKWQFRVVNFMKTVGDLSRISSVELAEAFLYSLPNKVLETKENKEVVSHYIQFLRAYDLPQRHLKRTSKDLNYIIEWQRFQTLAKPSKN
ncbi:competence protein CoiA [Chryseomicrobium palamuruense]|uniref:Competence protein CoiA n=1 Tax=Chryseomicrobium palamuruense TaxID=682973 RepID=A0ABV8URK3_9BACL